jgi:glycopeptide antibiotics resistance protein
MKKRELKDHLGDVMLILFLLSTALALMFFFIYSYNGIDEEEAKNLLVLVAFIALSLAGFLLSLNKRN